MKGSDQTMDEERELTLKDAARLAGRSVRSLRSLLRSGALQSAAGLQGGAGDEAGEPRLTVARLKEAGLLGASGSPRSGESLVRAEAGTWLPAERTGDLLTRLINEREEAVAEHAERAERMYREVLDEQRRRLERVEQENRDMVRDLHEALRKIPKLLELEAVETAARKSEERATCAEDEARRAQERSSELEAELRRSEERRHELAATLERLRGRSLWARVVDREPPQPVRDLDFRREGASGRSGEGLR